MFRNKVLSNVHACLHQRTCTYDSLSTTHTPVKPSKHTADDVFNLYVRCLHSFSQTSSSVAELNKCQQFRNVRFCHFGLIRVRHCVLHR